MTQSRTSSVTNSLRERRKQQLRDEILDAARKLLETRGYAAVVMDELALEAGISKPTLYSYFPTKDALIAATIAREINRVRALTEPGESSGSPLARLALVLETVVRAQLHERREPIRLWMPEMTRLSCEHPEMLQAMRDLDERIGLLIGEGIEQGEIDPALDVATLVRAFYAMVGAIRFLPHQSSVGEPNPATAAQTLVTLFIRGVRAVEQRNREPAEGVEVVEAGRITKTDDDKTLRV